jgi:hypothetical protein
MLMTKLIAERTHLYGTRRLRAGDEYEASATDADLLVAVLMARYAPHSPSADELEQLRTEAEAVGVRVDRRWGSVRLNYEIKLARS